MKTPLALLLALALATLVSADDAPGAQSPSLEAQLAQAKGKISEYEKLLTEAEELMKKRLPVIEAELDSLSKPLVVGESAGAMTLADGRTLENVTITAITPTSITVRCGREMASIPWQNLPVYFQVRAAHAVVAAANKTVPPAQATTTPAEPEGDRIYLGVIDIRVVEQSDDYVTYSWTAKVGNPTEYSAKANTKIFLLDASGFQLDFAYGDELYVPAKSFRVLSGRSGVKKSIWSQMETYRVVLK